MAHEQPPQTCGEIAGNSERRELPGKSSAGPLLEPLMTKGRRARSRPTIAESRSRFEADLALLPEPACRIDAPQAPTVRLTERLRQITAETKRGLAARVRP